MAKTILAVDDSASIRQLVTACLSGAGYRVIEASDGLEGLEKAQSETIDLVLTDNNMPRMDGISMISRLRGTDAHRETPIIVLTSESSEAIKSRGRAAGATGWLIKPVDPRKLVELVAKVIG